MKSPAIPALIRCRRTGRAPLGGPASPCLCSTRAGTTCLRVRSPDGQHQQGLVSREIGVGAAPVLAGHAGIAHIHDTSRLGVNDHDGLGVATSCDARWRQLSQVQFKLSIGSGPTEPTLPDSESARASRSVDSEIRCLAQKMLLWLMTRAPLLDVARPLTCGLLFKICRDPINVHEINIWYHCQNP